MTSSAMVPDLPGFPLIESPLFEHLVADGRFGSHVEAAQQLHRDGFIRVDLGRDRMQQFADRIRADLDPHFDLSTWMASGGRGDLRLQDAWTQSHAVRELAGLPELLGLLELFWGRQPFPFQTLNFPVGTRQHLHSDAVHFHSEPAGFMCGVWVALEDIDDEAGPLEYVPGSQRLPYLQARDVGYRQEPGKTPDQSIFHAVWNTEIAAHELQRSRYTPRLGEALIWTANLLHGGAPVLNPSLTRWSQVTHYFFEGCQWYTPLLSDWPTGAVQWRQPFNILSTDSRPQQTTKQAGSTPAEPIVLQRALAAGDLDQAEAWLLEVGEEWALQLPSRWQTFMDQLEDETISRRLLPLLAQRLAEQPDSLAWNRWQQAIGQSMAAKASVDQLLRIAPGHYLAFGWSSAGGVVEAVARSHRGRWIVRAEPLARLRRDDVRELLALPVCQECGFVMELRLECDELLAALWVDGCSCAVAVTDVASTPYLDLVDSLLLLCQPSAMPMEALPHVLEAGVAEALLVHRTRLQTPAAWLDRIQVCHAFGVPAKAAEVTVVIPLYRRWDFVLGQLAAFAMDPCFVQGKAAILYVVDDPTITSDFLGWCLNHLQQELLQIDVVVLKANVGFSLACDLGVLQAETEHVCLLNSDVLPIQAGWLDPLLDCLDEQPGALVAPLLLYEAGEIQHAGMEVEWSSPARDCTACIHPLKGLRPEGFMHLDPAADPFVVEALSGAALLFERERFLAMGGFDPVFGRGDFEDLDLSLRWQAQHGPCVMVPASRLTHLERQSISREPDRLALWRQRLNAWMARRLFEQRGG